MAHFWSKNKSQKCYLLIILRGLTLKNEDWVLVFKKKSSNLHNSRITKYLGHEEFIYNYKFKNNSVFTAMLRNIEHPKHATINLNFSYPISKNIGLYLEIFHGYGQSLIEYQTKTTSAGIGINLSNWI